MCALPRRIGGTFSSADGHELPKHDLPETAINTDPPLHEEYRGLMQEVLNQNTINDLQPYVVELAHRLMDEFAAAGSVDLVKKYTEQLPPAVICRIVGHEPELAPEMRDVSIRLGGVWGTMTTSRLRVPTSPGSSCLRSNRGEPHHVTTT